MDYAALEENYEEVSGWVADFLALDVEDVLIQARGDADWLTGKEVLAGIDDGTVDGYYELQQEMMVSSGAITEDQKCPVSDYVIYDIIKEAGQLLSSGPISGFCLERGGRRVRRPPHTFMIYKSPVPSKIICARDGGKGRYLYAHRAGGLDCS